MDKSESSTQTPPLSLLKNVERGLDNGHVRPIKARATRRTLKVRRALNMTKFNKVKTKKIIPNLGDAAMILITGNGDIDAIIRYYGKSSPFLVVLTPMTY